MRLPQRALQPLIEPSMKLKMFCLPLLLTLPLTVLAQSHPAQASTGQSTDSILAKVYSARGGLAKIHAIQAQRVSGHISFGDQGEASFVVELKRPLKMHMELTAEDKVLLRVYDGKSQGWQNNPFTGKTTPEPMSEGQVRDVSEDADFDGPLVDYQSKGNQVELEGKDKLDGRDVWRLKLTTKDGDVRHYLFDAQSFLLLKWEGKRKFNDDEYMVESFFKDYRDVGGVKFAFEIDSSGSSPRDVSHKTIIDKIELNPVLEDSRFAKPPATEAPAPSSSATPPGLR
jgi:outer membrane lipoprotein-sorting protein